MQMLMFRGDWQAALPKLTELGNGLALISSLDAVTSAGHLQRMVCADVHLSHSLCTENHVGVCVSVTRTHG